MAGEMWVNRVAVVMIPVRPGTLTTATRVNPTYPNIRPKDSVHRESRAPPQGGVNRHLMLQPPKQPGPEFSSLGAMAPEDGPQHRFFGLTVGHG